MKFVRLLIMILIVESYMAIQDNRIKINRLPKQNSVVAL